MDKKGLQQLHRLKNDLEGAVESNKKRLVEHQSALYAKVNRPFDDKKQQADREISILAGSEEPISFEEAVQLFFRLDSALFRERNPALTDAEAAAVMEEIRDVLKMSTDLQQMQRLANSIDALEKLSAAGAVEEEIQQAIQDLVFAGSSKREYDISAHPEYLVFEYLDNKLLRHDQVVNLDKLQIKNGKIGNMQALGAVLEMMMGAGKTAVVLVLLSMLNADGENLSMAIIPAEFFRSMSPELQKSLGKVFKQVLETFEVSRETRLGVPDLQRIVESLSRAIEERKIMLLKSNTLQSLYLKYIEKWKEYAELQRDVDASTLKSIAQNLFGKDPVMIDLQKELKLYQQIFRIFKEQGNVIIDEVDAIMDVLRSFHFTVGQSKPLPAMYIDVIADVYLFAATDPELNQKIRLPFAQAPSNIAFTQDAYEREIRPLISRALLEGKLGKQDPELQNFLSKLTPVEKQHILQYLQGNMAEGEQILLKKASEHVQDVIALYKEEISELFSMTAQKKLNQHYGKVRVEGKTSVQAEEAEERKSSIDPHLAIPYRLGKPSQNSQHGTEMEQENYTIQMVLEEGITRDTIEKELDRLKTHYLEETLKYPQKPIETLPSYQAFLRMSGGARYDLANLREKEIEGVVASVNGNRALQIDLIKQYILPKINVYEMQLDADSQLFGMLFKVIQAMTGTAWNAQTFTKLIQAIFPSTTAAEVIDILWNKAPDIVSEINLTGLDLKDQTESRQAAYWTDLMGAMACPKARCSMRQACSTISKIEASSAKKSWSNPGGRIAHTKDLAITTGRRT